MDKIRAVFALFLTLSLTSLSTGQALVPAPTQGTKSRLVVLKNGHIMEGRVQEDISHWTIRTKEGSRLVLEKSRVDFVCDSLEEAYWQKNARTRATDIDGHEKLFYWCLKNNLHDLADNQIEILSQLPLKATRLEYLHRQLTVVLDKRAKAESIAVLQKGAPEKSSVKQSLLAEAGGEFEFQPLPQLNDPKVKSLPVAEAGKIAQVGFNAPIERELAIVPAETGIASPSIEELDKLTKSLPKPAVAMFKRKIEPLVVRSCMTEGCHQTESETMPIMSVGRGRLMPRRLSQRNLHSILKQTDPNMPLESGLFKAALLPHAGNAEPIVEMGSVQMQNLGNWLIMVSNKPYTMHSLPEWAMELVQQQGPADLPKATTGDEVPGDDLNLPSPPASQASPKKKRSLEEKLGDLTSEPDSKEPDVPQKSRRDAAEFNRRFGKK